MPLKSFLRCFIFLYLSAFSLDGPIPMQFSDIEIPFTLDPIPANYRISSDASAADVKQDIDISILIGKAHTGLTSTCLGLFFYYHPIDAVPLVPLYLGYSALVYCASSFDNFQTCKTLRHPEAKIALERFIFHQRSQSGFYGLSSMCFFCDAIVNPLLDFPFKHYGAVFVACAAVNSFLFD